VPQAGAGVEELLTVATTGDVKIVHGRGLIGPRRRWCGPPAKDPEHLYALRDRPATSAMVGVEPQYEFGWKFHYEVDEIITVAWDELWRFGTITGTPEAPELAIIRYQKVFGSDFITLIEGSIILRAAEAGATDIEFIEHLAAVRGATSDMAASMRNRFHTLVELGHGRPAPGCP
jgi:hypothetical protein